MHSNNRWTSINSTLSPTPPLVSACSSPMAAYTSPLCHQYPFCKDEGLENSNERSMAHQDWRRLRFDHKGGQVSIPVYPRLWLYINYSHICASRSSPYSLPRWATPLKTDYRSVLRQRRCQPVSRKVHGGQKRGGSKTQIPYSLPTTKFFEFR
jgi:hypothetical protein